MPQRTLSIPVTVAGAGEDPVYVRVALTDERVDGDGLEPDTPLDLLIARQDSMIGMRDNYGRIITPTGTGNGNMPAFDPPLGGPHNTDQPEPLQTPLALYSGIVTLDKSGKGNVLLTLPDYAGKVRVRVQAWSASRTGQTQASLAIRYPLNATLTLPDFLMPDDHADLTLALDNMDGPRGEYRIKVHAEGAVSVQDEAEAVVNLAEHEQRSQTVSVQAHGPGDGTVAIAVKGPDNIAFERRLPLKVRSGAPAVTRHAVIALRPGATLALDPALTANMRAEGIAYSAAISGGNELDLNGIARELAGEPANTAMGIVAGATPYLASDALLQALSLADAKGRLSQAVALLTAYQSRDGGFVQAGDGASNIWLTAYVTDFLGRAKTRGAAVSDVFMGQALDYLTLHTEPAIDPAYSAPGSPQTYSQQALATAAYANRVLAANGRLTLFQLRYFGDRFLGQMRSPVGAAFVAAAFADLGDKPAAASDFARAAALPADTLPGDLFGSDLRDQALLNAAMAESGAVAPLSIAAVATKTASVTAAHRQFNAQEAVWLFRAGISETLPEGRFKAKVGDRTVDQNTALSVAGQPLPAIKNLGDAPLHIALTASGAPAPGEVRDQGYEVQRWLFDAGGKAIDSGTLRQGDMAVVVLTGRFNGQGDAQPVLFDPLPAGWEVEAANIADPANRYPWLKDLTGGGNATVTDGLYSTMPRLVGDRHEFRVAYVVRTAVRGQFGQPGTLVEDRLQPAQSGRAAAGKTKVDPAS
jgi:VCBS repeat-containing protein